MKPPENEKIDVAILGATGAVGQQFIARLEKHPWFRVAVVAASERSEGKRYGDVVNWIASTPMPERVAEMVVTSCIPENIHCRLCFSGLDSSVAGDVEALFASYGKAVISNSKNHRMDSTVPLLVPEVNGDHLALISSQQFPGNGMIITNPNCAAVGLVMALKPLVDNFGVRDVHVVTMQAVSGAGFPGVPSLSVLDNLVPFIAGEEEKVETEPQKILGTLVKGELTGHPMAISAQCMRVPVVDGHTACVSVKLERAASAGQIIEKWSRFRALPQEKELPSAPEKPLIYWEREDYPQPRMHRMIGDGMTVSIGRLRPCRQFEWKFVLLSHNTIRGAAGGAILNAELLVTSEHWKRDG